MRLLFLLLFPFCAFAEPSFNKHFPRRLQLVAVDGFRAVDANEVKEIYRQASIYFKRMGFGFRLRQSTLPSDNSCQAFGSLAISSRIAQVECYRQHAITQGWHPGGRQKMITYYMTPPFITAPAGDSYKHTAWIGGIAWAICGDVATGNAQSSGLVHGVETGEDRVPHSAVVLAHEVGHLLCLHHKSARPNLMHPSANFYTSSYPIGGLPILKATKRELKKAWRKQRKAQSRQP